MIDAVKRKKENRWFDTNFELLDGWNLHLNKLMETVGRVIVGDWVFVMTFTFASGKNGRMINNCLTAKKSMDD